jgi:hydrogenase maturation protein HypF
MAALPTPAGPVLGAPVRRRFRVQGVVQGVGFRPFVHRLATELRLGGHVGNDSAGVFVEVEGTVAAVAQFAERLATDAPPLARVLSVENTQMSPCGDDNFTIVESRRELRTHTSISADAATCADCRRELFDPDDRRYRYPFTNCTNCGPRFTITLELPYDRANTTMRRFRLCARCRREYEDPSDRRHHAEPVACPDCGPQLAFEHAGTMSTGTDAVIAKTHAALAAGLVVAVKGLGGYHLACDATSGSAVTALRSRKHRPHKPLAVMARDLAVARTLAVIDEDAAAVLSDVAHPIVLVPRRADACVATEVAPDVPDLGVMLPYTPLHHLLFAPIPGRETKVPDVLVMTSGNLGDEPICTDDGDARRRLATIADAWLVHDRPIHVPCDDSVVRVEHRGRQREEQPVRRSRGHAPLPFPMPVPARPLLAVGGDLKTTCCLADGGSAWLTQHLGDMGTVESLHAFERVVAQFRSLYGVTPEHYVADRHPGYFTHGWAQRRCAEDDASLVLVQHHHAHVAALMAEHSAAPHDTVTGFAFDGTGFGEDGTVWGGEVLLATYGRAERLLHLAPVALPGGDRTVRSPARVALAHLRAAGVRWSDDLPPVAALAPAERSVLDGLLQREVGTVQSSSMGRLFDAVSALLDLCHEITFEGQAAIALESLAGTAERAWPIAPFTVSGGVVDPRFLVRSIVHAARAGAPLASVALAFHHAVADMVLTGARQAREATNHTTVGLTGGVFQNVLLTRLARERLMADGFTVLVHHRVPPNDGGIALGQAVVAATRLQEGTA